MKTEKIVFEQENKKVIQEGEKFFTRIFENGESFESGDFNTLERAKASLGIVPTVEKNNRIIAEFMGLYYCEKYQFEGWYKNHEGNERVYELKYNTDWNWLMPVVEKIEKTHCVDIFGKAVSIHEKYDGEMIVDQSAKNSSTKIEAVYTACLEFIKRTTN
jgi:hypothetical protein